MMFTNILEYLTVLKRMTQFRRIKKPNETYIIYYNNNNNINTSTNKET